MSTNRKDYMRKYRQENRDKIRAISRAHMKRVRRNRWGAWPSTNRLIHLRRRFPRYRIWSTRKFNFRKMLTVRVYHFELKAEPGNSTTAQSYEHLVTLLNFVTDTSQQYKRLG